MSLSKGCAARSRRTVLKPVEGCSAHLFRRHGRRQDLYKKPAIRKNIKLFCMERPEKTYINHHYGYKQKKQRCKPIYPYFKARVLIIKTKH